MDNLKKGLQDLQKTKQLAEDDIWDSLQRVISSIKKEYNNNVEVSDIEIWPEGINLVGSYECDSSYWSHLIDWDKVHRINEGRVNDQSND